MSTNKVYGDNPNKLSLIEKKKDGKLIIENIRTEQMKTLVLIIAHTVFLAFQKVMVTYQFKNMEKILV